MTRGNAHLPNHGIEREARHGTPADPLDAQRGAEELSRNSPAERTRSDEEDEVKHPRHDYEAPVRAGVLRVRRVDFDEGRVDHEGDCHDAGAVDLKGSPPDRVDGQDTDGRAEEGDDGVDGLEQQRGSRRDPDLGEDLRREVLDRAHARHLAAGLNHHDEDRAAQVRPPDEEIYVALGFLGVLFGDLELDQVELGRDVGVFDVAVGVELRKVAQCFVCAIVVAEPAGTFGEELCVKRVSIGRIVAV